MTCQKNKRILPPQKKSGNHHLNRAFAVKNDEYYTSYEDVEKICKSFAKHLKGKKVYSNCDTEKSAFVKYLTEHGEELGIESFEYSGYSYDDPENLNKLDACDVVITNPPFSKFQDYLKLITDHNKDYILVAPLTLINAWSWKYFENGQLFFTQIKCKHFARPDGSTTNVQCFVITSFADMDLYKDPDDDKQKPSNFGRKYDNYDAIECPKLAMLPALREITSDDQVIGVPITFMFSDHRRDWDIVAANKAHLTLDGKELFKRIMIKKKTGDTPGDTN